MQPAICWADISVPQQPHIVPIDIFGVAHLYHDVLGDGMGWGGMGWSIKGEREQSEWGGSFCPRPCKQCPLFPNFQQFTPPLLLTVMPS